MNGHKTVLLEEAVAALEVKEDGIYVDGTFGRGGHSRLILSKLGPKGKLVALDRDLSAVEEGKKILDPRMTMVHSAFSGLEEVVSGMGIGKVDGILLDLGVSSPQIDEEERGFSFRLEGPLDMRMDRSRGQSAADWIAAASENELKEVIRDYGEERFAKQIARAIIAARTQGAITTTRQLAEIVAKAVRTREPNQNPATRTFQAIRIFINRELEELSAVLPQCLKLLQSGGRLVVISFHSLEDRIVKHFMRDAATKDALPSRLPIRESERGIPKMRLVGRAVKPSDEEIATNPRARSAVMRIAERLEANLDPA